MKPNGRRAWRKAAKKLRRTMGRRWRSQEEWVYGKRWSELVPDLEAHRAHVTGAWFKRHGVTEQGPEKLDAQHLVRVYVGLWGTVDGDSVTYAMKPESFTARSLVGMTQGARKRLREAIFWGTRNPTSARSAGHLMSAAPSSTHAKGLKANATRSKPRSVRR